MHTPMEEEETQKPITDSVKPQTKKPTQGELPGICNTVSSSFESLLICKPNPPKKINSLKENAAQAANS